MNKSDSIMHDSLSACMDIYMDIHVSELRKFPKSVISAWATGQEWYSYHNGKPVGDIKNKVETGEFDRW